MIEYHTIGDEGRGVVVFEDLPGNALDAALDALGIKDDGFTGGIGLHAHGVAISSIPSGAGSNAGLNSNSDTASTWAVCGNWSTNLKAFKA